MTSTIKPKQYLNEVRGQYEDYPYPERNPEDEKLRIQVRFEDYLETVNHFCYRGKRSFTEPFKVLVAGGGTGDSTIFLAEQLRHSESGKVVHLDMSQASIAVAKKRAAIRGLTNIEWIHASLLDIPQLEIGSFDYITCLGVLHHLESPEEGLRCLKTVLKSDGAMALSIYGKYARTGVYQLQDMLRYFHDSSASRKEKVALTRKILKDLPKTNWFKRGEDLFGDEKNDTGLFDLLLHTQDRAFSVPEVYEYVEGAGLNLISFNNGPGKGSIIYQPESYLKDNEVREQLSMLPKRTRESMAELLCGSIIGHSFYVNLKEDSIASFKDWDMVPFSLLPAFSDIQKIGKSRMPYIEIETPTVAPIHLTISLDNDSCRIIEHIDGHASILEIFKKVNMDKDRMNKKRFFKAFSKWYIPSNDLGIFMLRKRGLERIPSKETIQYRLTRE